MKAVLLNILPILVGMITPDVIKQGFDAFLDIVENAAVDSSNAIDDKLVLPLCATFRVALNIPDDD